MKNYVQIAASCLFTWIKVGLVGILFSILCVGTSIWLVKKNYLSELSFFGNLADNPMPFILLIGSVIGVFFYFILAKKITIMTAINEVWKNKLAGFILPKIQIYTKNLMSVQSDKLKVVTESNYVKQLTNFAKKDKTMNRVQRLVLSYGLKDMDLSPNDFSRDDLPQFLALKVENKIHSLTQPPFKFFWIFFFAQLIVLIVAVTLS